MRIILLLIFLLTSVVDLHNCHADGDSDSDFSITYVTTDTNKSTVEFFKKFSTAINNRHRKIQLKTTHAEQLAPEEGMVYIAVGNRSLQKLLDKNITGPILAIFISRLSFYRILKKYSTDHKSVRISAVFSDPSPMQQLSLIKQLFPDKPTTAVLISQRTEFMRNELKIASEKTGVPLKIVTHKENDSISKTLHQLDSVRILLALPDSLIYNTDTVRRIILSAYRNNQSIIGFSRQLVNAGGLATVYTDIDNIKNEVVLLIDRYIAENKLFKQTYTRDFNIEVNKRVSSSYNLSVPNIESLKYSVKKSLEICCEK
jgi:ABC-type uncharacterized transport system substrate-binding protein